MKKVLLPILALFTIMLVLSGCSDGKKLKQQWMDAYGKQTEMQNYTFSGKADISVDGDQPAQSVNPLTTSLVSMLKNGSIAWQGVSSLNPVQLEAKLTVTPAGSNTNWDIPLLIKDNKMYVHLPVVNQPDEFLEADLKELSALSKHDNPLTAENVQKAGQITSTIMKEAIQAVNPKWIKKTKQSGDSALEKMTIVVEKKDWSEFTASLSDHFPQIVDALKNAGYPVDDQTAEQWKTMLNGSVLNLPMTVSASLDKDGFIREESIDLDMTAKDKDQKPHHVIIHLKNAYDDINQNPPFTMKVPEKTKSLLDILKVLVPGTQSGDQQ